MNNKNWYQSEIKRLAKGKTISFANAEKWLEEELKQIQTANHCTYEEAVNLYKWDKIEMESFIKDYIESRRKMGIEVSREVAKSAYRASVL
jgi:hypothetical protein